MARDQYFVVGFTLDPEFTVSQMPRVQGRIDVNVVVSVFKLIELTLGQTKTPVLPVVGSSLGNPVWSISNREQVRPEFCQGHLSVNWSAIVQ